MQFATAQNRNVDLSIVEYPQNDLQESRRSRIQNIKMERQSKGWNSNFGCKYFYRESL